MKRLLITYITLFISVLFFRLNIIALEETIIDVTGLFIETADNSEENIICDSDFMDEETDNEYDAQLISEDFVILPPSEQEPIIRYVEQNPTFDFADKANLDNMGSINHYYFEDLFLTLYLPLGGDIRKLALPMEGMAFSNWSVFEFYVPITWMLDDFDSEMKGYQTLYGDVTIPENYEREAHFLLEQSIYVYGPDETGPWNSGGTVIDIVNFQDIYYTYILPLDGDIRQLNLSTQANGYVNGNYDAIPVEVLWQYEAFDAGRPGRQILHGEFILPQNYFYFGPPPEQLIIVYNNEIGVETAVTASGGTQSVFRVPCNADLQVLFDKWNVNVLLFDIDDGTDDGYKTIRYPVTYDLSLVDVETPGIYYPFSKLPEYFVLNDFAKQGTAIVVQDPDEVDLNGWSVDSVGTIQFGWYKGIAYPELWVSIDEKKWQPANTLKYEAFWTDDFDPFSFNVHYMDNLYYSLNVFSDCFPEGHKYKLMIHYEEGGFSVNSMVFDFTEGKHIYSDDNVGPRDGDDREESNLPNPGGSGGNGNAGNEKQPPKGEQQDYEKDNNEKQRPKTETPLNNPLEAPYGTNFINDDNNTTDIIEGDGIIKDITKIEDLNIAEDTIPLDGDILNWDNPLHTAERENEASSLNPGLGSPAWDPENSSADYIAAYIPNRELESINDSHSIENPMKTEELTDNLSDEMNAPNGEITDDLDAPEHIGDEGKTKSEQNFSIMVVAAISIFMTAILWKVFGKRLVAPGEK